MTVTARYIIDCLYYNDERATMSRLLVTVHGINTIQLVCKVC